jgi:MraZ protein
MFRGRFEHTIDPKGRLSVPAKFREVLLGKSDDRIVITNFVLEAARCLDVYPLDEWLRFEEEIRKKPRFDRRMVMFQNYYLAGACECSVDKQGRILISPLLRTYANLKRDVVLVSARREVDAGSGLSQRLGILSRKEEVGRRKAMLQRNIIQDISVIDVSGDIDFREMIRIKGVIGSLIEKERIKVVLNLKAVDHINYLSIGVLVEQLKTLRNLNGDLKLAGMSSYLRNIFKAVGMDQFFEEYTSLEDAVESFDEDWEWDGTYH